MITQLDHFVKQEDLLQRKLKNRKGLESSRQSKQIACDEFSGLKKKQSIHLREEQIVKDAVKRKAEWAKQ